ncbi:hypothetical protein ACA910_008388 [Epithemia clementina (nom. ined.)]
MNHEAAAAVWYKKTYYQCPRCVHELCWGLGGGTLFLNIPCAKCIGAASLMPQLQQLHEYLESTTTLTTTERNNTHRPPITFEQAVQYFRHHVSEEQKVLWSLWCSHQSLTVDAIHRFFPNTPRHDIVQFRNELSIYKIQADNLQRTLAAVRVAEVNVGPLLQQEGGNADRANHHNHHEHSMVAANSMAAAVDVAPSSSSSTSIMSVVHAAAPSTMSRRGRSGGSGGEEEETNHHSHNTSNSSLKDTLIHQDEDLHHPAQTRDVAEDLLFFAQKAAVTASKPITQSQRQQPEIIAKPLQPKPQLLYQRVEGQQQQQQQQQQQPKQQYGTFETGRVLEPTVSYLVSKYQNDMTTSSSSASSMMGILPLHNFFTGHHNSNLPSSSSSTSSNGHPNANLPSTGHTNLLNGRENGTTRLQEEASYHIQAAAVTGGNGAHRLLLTNGGNGSVLGGGSGDGGGEASVQQLLRQKVGGTRPESSNNVNVDDDDDDDDGGIADAESPITRPLLFTNVVVVGPPPKEKRLVVSSDMNLNHLNHQDQNPFRLQPKADDEYKPLVRTAGSLEFYDSTPLSLSSSSQQLPLPSQQTTTCISPAIGSTIAPFLSGVKRDNSPVPATSPNKVRCQSTSPIDDFNAQNVTEEEEKTDTIADNNDNNSNKPQEEAQDNRHHQHTHHPTMDHSSIVVAGREVTRDEKEAGVYGGSPLGTASTTSTTTTTTISPTINPALSHCPKCHAKIIVLAGPRMKKSFLKVHYSLLEAEDIGRCQCFNTRKCINQGQFCRWYFVSHEHPWSIPATRRKLLDAYLKRRADQQQQQQQQQPNHPQLHPTTTTTLPGSSSSNNNNNSSRQLQLICSNPHDEEKVHNVLDDTDTIPSSQEP